MDPRSQGVQLAWRKGDLPTQVISEQEIENRVATNYYEVVGVGVIKFSSLNLKWLF